MQPENGTERDVDYEQVGEGGGGLEVGPGQTRGGGKPEPCVPRTGSLRPGQNTSFTPKCRPPWTVRFTRGGAVLGTSRSIQAHEAHARVRLETDGSVTVIT